MFKQFDQYGEWGDEYWLGGRQRLKQLAVGCRQLQWSVKCGEKGQENVYPVFIYG